MFFLARADYFFLLILVILLFSNTFFWGGGGFFSKWENRAAFGLVSGSFVRVFRVYRGLCGGLRP